MTAFGTIILVYHICSMKHQISGHFLKSIKSKRKLKNFALMKIVFKTMMRIFAAVIVFVRTIPSWRK